MNLEVDFSWVSSQGLSPPNIFITALWYPDQRTHWTYSFQRNYMLISRCCFNPSSLWGFTMQQQKTNTMLRNYLLLGKKRTSTGDMNATFSRVLKVQSWFVKLCHVEKNMLKSRSANSPETGQTEIQNKSETFKPDFNYSKIKLYIKNPAISM